MRLLVHTIWGMCAWASIGLGQSEAHCRMNKVSSLAGKGEHPVSGVLIGWIRATGGWVSPATANVVDLRGLPAGAGG